MSLRQWWNRAVACLLTPLLRLYIATLRVQVFGKERAIQELSTSATGCCFLIWHDSILLTPLLGWVSAFQPLCILISYSRDGDIPSEVGKRFSGVDVLRVKHTSRAGALMESCRLLSNQHSLLITPDGPRGPRHQVKPGALFACQRSNASIISIVVAASRKVTLSSWDRFYIPLPFSKVLISILEPIPPDANLELLKAKIEQRMAAEEERLTHG